MDIRKLIFRLIKVVLCFFLVVIFLQIVYMIILKWVAPPITITQIVSYAIGNDVNKRYVSWGQISPAVKLAVISGEDAHFLRHHGFDFSSISRQIQGWRKGKRLRGGSTLSQQVVKNVFLWQGGGWFRKGLETYLTLMAEFVWGKRRIMELYLNVVEMGNGIFGIEAVSQYYFHKPARDLTSTEAALIVATLPNPKKYTIHPFSPIVEYRYSYLLKKMRERIRQPEILKFLSAV